MGINPFSRPSPPLRYAPLQPATTLSSLIYVYISESSGAEFSYLVAQMWNFPVKPDIMMILVFVVFNKKRSKTGYIWRNGAKQDDEI